MTERYLAKWYTMTMAVVVASATIAVTLVRGQSTVETFNVVERRSSRDVYITMNMRIICHSEETYLVFEGRCVSNEELTTGMKIGLANLYPLRLVHARTMSIIQSCM